MENWATYLFQYTVGSLVFIIGMILAFRSGDMKFQWQECRHYVVILVVGLLGYAIFHGAWIYYAINS